MARSRFSRPDMIASASLVLAATFVLGACGKSGFKADCGEAPQTER